MSADLSVVFPEIVLAVYAMVALLWGVYTGKDKVASGILWITVATFIIVALWIGFNGETKLWAFDGMFLNDAFSRFAKITVLLAAAAVLWMSDGYLIKRGLLRFEYPILVVLSVIGMMVMISAGDLITLYMGLELQSLALYVIAAMRRDSVQSTEAGLKYFVLGALSSGLLLYGASLIYGYAGTTEFEGIMSTIHGGEHLSLGLLLGLAFMFAGLAFKVSAVPFHMWTPDVYEGAPTPVTAFFATVPKVAAMALFARLAHSAFGSAAAEWGQIVAFLSLASMFWGAIAAIGQTDIKRLMAYSSIAHMGFALMGLAAGTERGVEAMLIYMVIYVAMNIGTFAFILMMSRDDKPVTDIASLNMYSRHAPTKAIALLVLLFSLAGVPPLLGFFGKFAVLQAAVQADMAWLAVAGVVASVIGAFYYLRIVYLMYFGEETNPLDPLNARIPGFFLLFSAIIMLVGIINLFGVEGLAQAAAQSLVK